MLSFMSAIAVGEQREGSGCLHAKVLGQHGQSFARPRFAPTAYRGAPSHFGGMARIGMNHARGSHIRSSHKIRLGLRRLISKKAFQDWAQDWHKNRAEKREACLTAAASGFANIRRCDQTLSRCVVDLTQTVLAPDWDAYGKCYYYCGFGVVGEAFFSACVFSEVFQSNV